MTYLGNPSYRVSDRRYQHHRGDRARVDVRVRYRVTYRVNNRVWDHVDARVRRRVYNRVSDITRKAAT